MTLQKAVDKAIAAENARFLASPSEIEDARREGDTYRHRLEDAGILPVLPGDAGCSIHTGAEREPAMIRSVAFSYAGEPGQQTDFEQAAQPDGLAVVLADGSTIFVGDRDGYGPPAVWVIGPDGEDLWDSPLFPAEAAADDRLLAIMARTVAPASESEQRLMDGNR